MLAEFSSMKTEKTEKTEKPNVFSMFFPSNLKRTKTEKRNVFQAFSSPARKNIAKTLGFSVFLAGEKTENEQCFELSQIPNLENQKF